MTGYFIFLHFLGVMVQARPNSIGEMFLSELTENDANLNPGFDIDAFRLDQLNLHNYYRSLHGVPLMTRDATLEAQAQGYAEYLAEQDQGMHHCKLPDCDRHGAGENLATAWGSTTAETNATKGWYDEVWDYNYCHGENISIINRPGHEGNATGHFTQVIWKGSTELGIGYARTADRKTVFVVGRYKGAGNMIGHYEENVLKADYLFETLQDNCNGQNGAFTPWSEPGECTRSCGGGIKFETRTCTNPKPSLNGADCDGVTSQLAPGESWCNIESCSDEQSYRDQQCDARGHPAQSWIFDNQCILYCHSGSGNVYSPAGVVDDGTHCNDGSGACVSGDCNSMPQYVAPTTPPPTNGQGQVAGSYTGTPSSNVWDNIIYTVPNGKTNVVITNRQYNYVIIKVGYTSSTSKGYQFSEASWMNSWVDYYGEYETTKTIVGVTFVYKRVEAYSTITIAGPVHPDAGYHLVLFAEGSSPADISWTRDA